ncbi:uncharacterized protein LOC120255785 [Dioscorea cayenensis subsp. rotundata]|uniref:Uncharacterized protein LOC120255785 n=1 Tax=Dioscorea cayennensis subsp. rotundata TaxID=55577 RepID=A0AB40AX17_DIOCR|nr:uncharacterized protein LOC120255785 [Dioscorea cayenensis subsp. rotundata]
MRNSLLTRYIKDNEIHPSGYEEIMRNTNATVRNLEHHIAQMSKIIEERLPGSLPSSTEVNPKESRKVITLRSGKQLSGPTAERSMTIVDIGKKIEGKGGTELPKYQPKLPYPMKARKYLQEEQYKNFFDVFNTFHINVSFIEALVQMPRYAKFLKELLINKRKLEEVSSVTLGEECLALITNKLSKKKKDLRGFIIPCTIGELVDEKALPNIWASINLMLYKIFQKLGLGELKSTTMTLQLADRSLRQPRGFIEDVLVKMDKFIFPVDFVILDVDEKGTFMKDELCELLEDDPPKADEPEEELVDNYAIKTW